MCTIEFKHAKQAASARRSTSLGPWIQHERSEGKRSNIGPPTGWRIRCRGAPPIAKAPTNTLHGAPIPSKCQACRRAKNQTGGPTPNIRNQKSSEATPNGKNCRKTNRRSYKSPRSSIEIRTDFATVVRPINQGLDRWINVRWNTRCRSNKMLIRLKDLAP